MKRGLDASQPENDPDIELSEEQKLQRVIEIVESLGRACTKETARVERPNDVLPLPRPRFLRG